MRCLTNTMNTLLQTICPIKNQRKKEKNNRAKQKTKTITNTINWQETATGQARASGWYKEKSDPTQDHMQPLAGSQRFSLTSRHCSHQWVDPMTINNRCDHYNARQAALIEAQAAITGTEKVLTSE